MCDDNAYYDKVDEIEELEAEIERLRAALERTRPHVRNEIIEECARVAEMVAPIGYPQIAAAIRALKSNTGS